jgi:hypothetical protein
MGQCLMGVWDLKHLDDEIKKWEKLASHPDISENDRSIYLNRAEETRKAYTRETSDFEERATKFEEKSDGQEI